MSRLEIEPRGIVKGGFCDYIFHPSGLVEYQVEIRIRVFLVINKTFHFKGTAQTDPENLSSKSLKTGKFIPFGPITLSVAKIEGTAADLLVSFPGYGDGVGRADLSQSIVEIDSLHVKGSVSGYSIEIVASRE